MILSFRSSLRVKRAEKWSGLDKPFCHTHSCKFCEEASVHTNLSRQ